jgi:hypothetical protein
MRLMQTWWKSAALALVLATTMGVGSASAKSRVYVRVGPPAPIVEVRTAAPGRGYVWVPGFHRWTGAAYAWVPGAWQRPPRGRAVWVPGHWQHDRRGWFFVNGHWR